MPNTCVVCAYLAGGRAVIPPSGDCRDGACDYHRTTVRWVELLKPTGEVGVESVVLPDLFVEQVS